ncbi:hypothetical protein [Salipiger sp.]|uniref:hypothetical protein n=1 Tax=Salipiger sp. TaxID=2078585 RepID=UPI003A97DC49
MPRIAARMASWHGGQIETIEGGRHEVLMEDALTRGRILTRIADVFASAGVHPDAARSTA